MGVREDWLKTSTRVDLDDGAYLEFNRGFMGGVSIIIPPEFIAILERYRDEGMAWLVRPEIAGELAAAFQRSLAFAADEMREAA